MADPIVDDRSRANKQDVYQFREEPTFETLFSNHWNSMESIPGDISRDEKLYGQVMRRFFESGQRELLALNVTVSKGCIFVSGRVSTYHAKQIAQKAVCEIDDAEAVQFDITVDRLSAADSVPE